MCIRDSFRADCGSCSKEIVSEIEKHCTHFYIRANRCSSLYDDLFSLRGWKTEEINGIQFELNSILVEKWEGKCYRLVIQRQKRMDGELDLWEGEYTYRCILTNDYDSSTRDIVEFYNKRGGKERIFDDMNNGFGWNRLPKSFKMCIRDSNLPEAMKCLKALIADVPYSNKKLASMDMEERYRLVMSTIFNSIGCRVAVSYTHLDVYKRQASPSA